MVKKGIFKELRRSKGMKMEIKTILYIITVPFVIWVMDAININSIFKKNKVFQASIVYIMICICVTYLVVNFFVDFFNYSKFI